MVGALAPPEAQLATHESAEKRARQAEKRRERNRTVKSRVKSALKAFGAAVESDKAAAAARLADAERELRRAASKGIVPARRASRKIGRMAHRLHRAK
jgi:small subunit ribosomal protein S20